MKRTMSKKEKLPKPVKKLIPKMFIDRDPPVISRDPKPRLGIMSVYRRDIDGNPSWQERFFVLARGFLSWFPSECQTKGYDLNNALGSIPVKFVLEAVISCDGTVPHHNLLDLITERNAYHFKADLFREVGKWQDAIMNTSPPGGQRFLTEIPTEKSDDGNYHTNFFNNMNSSGQKVGGIPFGKPPELASNEQNDMMHNLFETIAAQDVAYQPPKGGAKEKPFIEASDVAKFIDSCMTSPSDTSLVPTIEECQQAIDEAIENSPEHAEQCDFDTFKAAICKSVFPGKTYGSEMARIIQLAMSGKKEYQMDDEMKGEMTVAQKLFEYHKFMGNVLTTCRDGSISDEVSNKISLKKVVAESYLDNIVTEIESLLKRHEAYKTRMRTLEPSLRSCVQWGAVDDVFDMEMLPGERWM